jgi:hypothetical protein
LLLGVLIGLCCLALGVLIVMGLGDKPDHSSSGGRDGKPVSKPTSEPNHKGPR